MKEIYGDLWELAPKMDAICITTNGEVRKDGRAIMGRGCAKQAAMRWPELPELLGGALLLSGNHIHTFLGWDDDFHLVTFPVKHRWRERADLNLIEASAQQFLSITDELGWKRVLLPRPGTGNGRLRWEDVRKRISPLLDNRFLVVTW